MRAAVRETVVIAVLIAATSGWLSAQRTSPPAGVVRGLDHVAVAVRDLAAATKQFQDLGFTLKPGRPHDNGLSNQHAKFPDGTEIELITAPAGVDELTRTYRRHLEAGDGPAFLALFVPPPGRMPPALTAGLPHIFFGARNASPTDRPEHFAHENTAESLVSVWLAGDDLTAERRFLNAINARWTEETVSVPAPTKAAVAHLAEGTIVFLPGSRQVVRDRKIVGMTVVVVDRDAAAKAVGPLAHDPAPDPTRRRSVFVPPQSAHGVWLELRPGVRRVQRRP